MTRHVFPVSLVLSLVLSSIPACSGGNTDGETTDAGPTDAGTNTTPDAGTTETPDAGVAGLTYSTTEVVVANFSDDALAIWFTQGGTTEKAAASIAYGASRATVKVPVGKSDLLVTAASATSATAALATIGGVDSTSPDTLLVLSGKTAAGAYKAQLHSNSGLSRETAAGEARLDLVFADAAAAGVKLAVYIGNAWSAASEIFAGFFPLGGAVRAATFSTIGIDVTGDGTRDACFDLTASVTLGQVNQEFLVIEEGAAVLYRNDKPAGEKMSVVAPTTCPTDP